MTWRLPPVTASENLIARLTAVGDPVSSLAPGATVHPGDVTWLPIELESDSGEPAFALYCGGRTSHVSASISALPSAPASYTGVTTPGWDTASRVGFVAPADGEYIADVALSQGAIVLGDSAPVVSSKEVSLGQLDRGTNLLYVSAADGPPARWTIGIRAAPVRISNMSASPSVTRPDVPITVAYRISAPATIDAAVRHPAGHVVRTLATNLNASRGARTILWDGLDLNGRPVTDGRYKVAITAAGADGRTTYDNVDVTIDSAPPAVRQVSPRVLPSRHGLVISIADKLSGIRAAYLHVAGTRPLRLQDHQDRIVYRPRRGWRRGSRPKWTVSAVDRAGNRRTMSGVFRVR